MQLRESIVKTIAISIVYGMIEAYFTLMTDLLPTLKGEGSLRVVHRFVVYHLHF